MWVHWAVFFAILSVAWPLNSTELQLSCSHPAEQLVKTLRSFRHAALLARTNVHAAPAHTCGAWKGRGKKLPGCAFTPANHTVKWFFDTPLTQQFSNPNYRPVVTPENHPRHPGCLFALNAAEVDWSQLTIVVVPTHQTDRNSISYATVWVLDMAGRVVIEKPTIFLGNLRSQRMINSTAMMAMVDFFWNEAQQQPVVFWVWDIATNREEVLVLKSHLPPHHGSAHHDFTYNPTTNTIIVMFRFLNGDYDSKEDPNLFMERLVEFTWSGQLIWHWDVHRHISVRSVHPKDLAEGECREHSSDACQDVFHGNTVFWDTTEDGTGEGILYYMSRYCRLSLQSLQSLQSAVGAVN
uniref:Uncharacterized protein n=1 Tax=Eutreptiella gymnastica TaxID=73025 RepID=A0A7S4CY24_9EUGL|mmetsp:Transcript_98569/g.165923  ORF Transcript_98569/g.165923 Transcript_98569/m.165923 type:complete len:352 (-) Transcript_98569:450-1505(-)|eukprot:CAMPEP_0174310172 /NCGR_PEP_ID=MMETSP0810-20121108/2877_1 /TAXON_ID=73025 ORGANISM="Eutreptiella gymnastica-like, Strain CCMP1594" /NCGR_SAMPLE_ID=MMETSP0810 /ASSEMBLY_ACC=CAM_ASM_000659 /LENGTH=351 /DNA_ID=CAMNT_0015418005 /DNA_START=43 /DNA_END=1098 /DNA_ORIENTATION=-